MGLVRAYRQAETFRDTYNLPNELDRPQGQYPGDPLVPLVTYGEKVVRPAGVADPRELLLGRVEPAAHLRLQPPGSRSSAGAGAGRAAPDRGRRHAVDCRGLLGRSLRPLPRGGRAGGGVWAERPGHADPSDHRQHARRRGTAGQRPSRRMHQGGAAGDRRAAPFRVPPAGGGAAGGQCGARRPRRGAVHCRPAATAREAAATARGPGCWLTPSGWPAGSTRGG